MNLKLLSRRIQANARARHRPTRNDAFVLLIRAVLLMTSGMVFIMLLELIPSLIGGHSSIFNLSTMTAVQALTLMAGLSQGANELMAVSFTVIAIAVPLTADLYSLKFLEFIIKDRVITSILILTVFVNLNTSWVSGMITEEHIPVAAMYLSIALVILTFSVIFPYLYYVFRFLHPRTLLTRLEAEIEETLKQTLSGARYPVDGRRRVAAGIEHIADIAARTIERSDRNTAIECIHTLERVIHGYWRVKENLPSTWFTAEPELFLGFAARAMDDLHRSKTWVEMKLLSQICQILGATLLRLHDVVGAAAHTLRKFGQEEPARSDPALRELTADYFNTFVRLSIVNRDTRSIFTVFDEYRAYAQSLNPDYPEAVREIAYYFEYYAQVARDCGLTFIVESLAHDLGLIVQHAYEINSEDRAILLEQFINFDNAAQSPLAGVKKAQAILASRFMLLGHEAEVARIGAPFAGLDPVFVQTLASDLLRIKREEFWEVSGRRINMDFVPPLQRAKLKDFFDGLLQAPTPHVL